MLRKALVWTLLACMLVGCAAQDSRTALAAQQKLIGWSELDLETCLGVPDKNKDFGDTHILTYIGSSTSNKSVNLGGLLFGGLTIGGGGTCRATFRVQEGRVAEVRYAGETDAVLGRDAYCAPIVRGCMDQAENHPPASLSNTPESTPRSEVIPRATTRTPE